MGLIWTNPPIEETRKTQQNIKKSIQRHQRVNKIGITRPWIWGMMEAQGRPFMHSIEGCWEDEQGWGTMIGIQGVLRRQEESSVETPLLCTRNPNGYILEVNRWHLIFKTSQPWEWIRIIPLSWYPQDFGGGKLKSFLE